MTLTERARRIRLVLLDVDGVLTDGAILLGPRGTEHKRFHVRDGAAIVWAQRAGLLTGLLSGRRAGATTARAAQLSIPIVAQGRMDKAVAYERILTAHGLEDPQVAYMGDDLLDLPVLRRAGLAAAPADAVAEVLRAVHWTSVRGGGQGAVRELIELILKAQDRWEGVVAGYDAKAARA